MEGFLAAEASPEEWAQVAAAALAKAAREWALAVEPARVVRVPELDSEPVEAEWVAEAGDRRPIP